MSLDVSLKDPTATYESDYFYDANITHNLGKMAKKAGIYEALWRPYMLTKGYYDLPEGDSKAEYKYEDGVTVFAKDIIEILCIGLKDLKERPEYFKQFDSPNGWGMYEHFVPFVEKYIQALDEYPRAIVLVSR